MPHNQHRRRRTVRFRPLVDSSDGLAGGLDRRLLMSAVPTHHHAEVRPEAAHKAEARVTPKQEVIKQYDLFLSNLYSVESSYVEALNEQSTGTVSVSTTLTAPYTAGSASMQVADASVFGATGAFSPTVTATAQIGSIPVGTFTLLGSQGNQLAISTTQSSNISLGSGTTLTAQVPLSASSSAQSIFPSYIMSGTNELAVNLVAYFNSLPIKLPRFYAIPHYPQRGGAIQQYVYELVDGASSTSLKSTLTAITLPQTPGADLDIYNATVQTAVDASESQMISSVQQIFANKLPVVYTAPSSSGSSSGTGSTSTSSSSTGSSSSGAA